MRELYIPSTDKKNMLHVVVWEPKEKIKAIMQISHGMVEYIMRYDDFANYLSDKGILVIGNDHLGHGLSVAEKDLGYFGEEKSKTVIMDLYKVTRFAKKYYGEDIPYFMFGHSMGSFMARKYIMTFGDKIDGAIISGTGSQPGAVLCAGSIIAGAISKLRGEKYRSKFVKNLSFKGYLDHIDNPSSENDWLTRDADIVEKYNNDKFCSFTFTLNGYKTIFETLKFIQKKANRIYIPTELPVFLIAGTEDPVGSYGKDVENIYKMYQKIGVEDATLKLYEGARHEVINELEKEQVYEDVYNWIAERL